MVSETVKPLNKNSILEFLKTHRIELKAFGVERIGLFGSFALGLEHQNSDIDFLVDIDKPDLIKMAQIALFLENQFGRKVDLTRRGKHLRARFLQSIEPHIIYA